MSIPIQVGNENVQIPLYEGDNVRTVATNFLSSRGISMDNLDTLVRLISEQIQSNSAVVVETPEQSQEEVSVDVTITVPLSFRIGEPLEAAALRTFIYFFIHTHTHTHTNQQQASAKNTVLMQVDSSKFLWTTLRKDLPF